MKENLEVVGVGVAQKGEDQEVADLAEEVAWFTRYYNKILLYLLIN